MKQRQMLRTDKIRNENCFLVKIGIKFMNLFFVIACLFDYNFSFVSSQTNEDSLFSDCGAQITAKTGRITSPNYPNAYPVNMLCTWTIDSDEANNVQLTLTDIDVEDSRNCQYDHLLLQFARGVSEQFCGQGLPDGPLEGALPATITLSSDRSIVGRGFAINFQVLTPCLSGPCLNDATCENTGDAFECLCSTGREGQYCEIETNECLSDPCQNGGTCTDLVGSFACTCAHGLTGQACEIITDYCFHLEPCLNYATCLNQEESYSCFCSQGYTGENCGIEINECSSNPCENGGSCLDQLGQYTCNCPGGYSGQDCELLISTSAAPVSFPQTSTLSAKSCDNVECLNGGSCVSLDNATLPVCQCLDGFEGVRCQKNSTYSKYFIGMMVAIAVSLLCVLVLAIVVYYLIRKQMQQTVQSIRHLQDVSETNARVNPKHQKRFFQKQKNFPTEKTDFTLPNQVQEKALKNAFPMHGLKRNEMITRH